MYNLLVTDCLGLDLEMKLWMWTIVIAKIAAVIWGVCLGLASGFGPSWHRF